jgi:hypothetical protein
MSREAARGAAHPEILVGIQPDLRNGKTALQPQLDRAGSAYGLLEGVSVTLEESVQDRSPPGPRVPSMELILMPMPDSPPPYNKGTETRTQLVALPVRDGN